MDVFKFNLILKQCERDNKAFETLFDFYYPRIKLHIHKKFPDACADDVAQEFFLQLMKSHGFNHVQNPTAWVFACCDNIAKRMLIGENATLPLLVSENYSVSEDLVETEILNDQAKRVFDALGDDCTQKIFYLYYWEGYNLREIAQILSLNISTIKQRHARGIKKVKNLL